MATIAEEHQAYEVPPRKGQVFALAIDATSRPYDLITLAMGSANAPEGGQGMRQEVFITVSAEGTDAFIAFDKATLTVDDTSVNALAASPITFGATQCAKIVKDGQPRRFRLDRKLDRFMAVKAVAAASGTLRVYVSSPVSPSV